MRERIIVSRCLECSCIYGCNTPTENGGIEKNICLKCAKMHSCIHRVVIIAKTILLKDRQDCETCTNKSNCLPWVKGSKKDCNICENCHRCIHKWMTSLTDEGEIQAHGFCTDECRALGNSRFSSDEALIRKVLANCHSNIVDELIFFLRSIGRMYEILPYEKKAGLAVEAIHIRREFILKMLATTRSISSGLVRIV